MLCSKTKCCGAHLRIRTDVVVVYLDRKQQLLFGHSRGDGNQELVEASEEDVGPVAQPNVVCPDHKEQQTGLNSCDNGDDQLGPDIPADFHKARHKGRDCTC